MALRTFNETRAASAPVKADAPRSEHEKFKQYLLANKVLLQDAADRAERIAIESKEKFEAVLTRLGIIPEKTLAEALSGFLDVPIALAEGYPASPVLEGRLSRKFMRDAQFIPLEDRPDGLTIAMVNPLDGYTRDAVRFAVGKPVTVSVALPADLEAAFSRLYAGTEAEDSGLSDLAKERAAEVVLDDIDRLKDIASDAPVIRLVNQIITRAVETRASDIHIEPMENGLTVRYRIDGVLHPVEAPPPQLASAVVSRVKVMAKLDIAERRLPQDGRIVMAVRGKDIDFRVSTTPTIHGESVVLRILDRGQLALDFTTLGFDGPLIRRMRQQLAMPHGIVLVTGPTGSGKTTTLYAALLELNTQEKKLLTIEDPVEYHLDGVNQVQVKPQIGLTFASALRSFLRQDPDIMMIGEIRDLETAQIAVQSALTGHLILSTLHTNDAASAITRLLDMGVEDYLLTSTINGVAAQRLVRTLCPDCREPYEPLAEAIDRLHLRALAPEGPILLYRAKGCEHCAGTGYHGRSSIVEMLTVDDQIRRAILKGEDSTAIHKLALSQGMQPMRDHGFCKALAGMTTVEEVFRATGAA
jgi:general secretion pathway protein E